MASPQAALKVASKYKINMFNADGDYQAAAAIAKAVSAADAEVWLDMKGYSGVWVGVMGVNATSRVTALSIVADANSAGTDGNIVIATSADSAATHEGGWMQVEATAEQIVQEGADNSKALRYIAVKITANANTDEFAITVVRYGPRFAYSALTAGSAANATIA